MRGASAEHGESSHTLSASSRVPCRATQVAVGPFRVPLFNWLAVLIQLCSVFTALLSLAHLSDITDTCNTRLDIKFCPDMLLILVLLLQIIPLVTAAVLVVLRYYALIRQTAAACSRACRRCMGLREREGASPSVRSLPLTLTDRWDLFVRRWWPRAVPVP